LYDPAYNPKFPKEQQASKTHSLLSLEFQPYNTISTTSDNPAMMSLDPSESAHIDPVDNDTMEPTSIPTTQDQEASTFVKAIGMIIGKDSGSKPKLQETRPFQWIRLTKTPHFYLTVQI